MTVGEFVTQGFHYARTSRSLWLFGFVVGVASGGSGGGGTGGGQGGGGSAGAGAVAAAGAALGLSRTEIAAIVATLLSLAVAAFVLRFVSEGALIEGVARLRQGARVTTRDGFRAGWTHWAVLLRIALVYLAATVGSLVLLAAPGLLAFFAFGPAGGIALALPALVVGVPWLVTLYLVQAFGARIAVLEHRHAIVALRKARLFLHGRLMHGLRLMVASFVGTLALGLAGFVVVVPVALLMVALLPVLSLVPIILIACLVLAPVGYVLIAMMGTLRSSIWTIGYLTQVES
jgi:hypothetical protein